MNKYINAKELFNQALAEEVDVGIYQEDGSYEGIYTAVLTSDLVKMATNMPYADVVEVVRCENCKHHQSDDEMNFNYCKFHGVYINTDFCADGERGESE